MLGDLNKLKVVELKAELANRGLDTKGVKAVLVDRLKAALEEEGGGVSLGSIASGSEDPKSSQDENEESDEVSTTPARRGRRTTSTKESSPSPDQQEGDLPGEQPVVSDATSVPQFPSTFGQDSSSTHIREEEEPVHVQQDEEPVRVQQDEESADVQQDEESADVQQDEESADVPQDEESSETGNTDQVQQDDESSETGNTDQVQQDDESSESKYSDEQQEPSPPEESAVEESQSSFATNQEESQPLSTEPVGDSQSSLPDFQEESQVTPVEAPEPSSNPIDTESAPQPEASHDTMDIKVEPPDSQQIKQEDEAMQDLDEMKEESSQAEGSRRIRKSRFTDNDDVVPTATDVKEEEEPMETDTTSVDPENTQVKVEPSNDRKRRRSSSRSPRRRSRSPQARRQDDEPEMDDSAMLLSWYDSDLNLVIEKDQFLTATPMFQHGFGYVWAGARASFGFLKGRVCYEVKCVEECDVSHLEDEPNPHVLRVGWSVQGTSMQLGEEKLSYGYGGTGKGSVNCQFKDYGKVFGVGDTITAYLDMDSEPKILSYAVNGESQGVAYEISSDALEGKALFPHILSKNMKFSVQFLGEPSYPLLEEFTFCGDVLPEDRVPGPRRPEKREDCQMIMMCGLPGCGKTYWANKYTAENPEKMYNILGTNNLIDKMKVMGLPRKRNYSGRWDALIEKCTKCLNKLLEVAGRRRRNYILDQTNVYPSAVRRKMKSFEGFKRRAVVIVPADDEFQSRVAKREAEEGKDVPDTAVLEMKANFKVPEVGEVFSEVTYVELPEEEAKAQVEKYRDEAKEKGYVAQTHQSKRFKSERSGSSGDRRFDDRHSSRDGRDYRDRRDHRDRDNRDSRDHRDRGSGYRPRGGPNDRNRSGGGWQHRGGPGGGWRDRNDGYRGGRGDSRGPWRSGGGRGGMGGGYDRRGGGGGYGQSRGGYGARGGSKGWGYNQGSGGSSWGSWSQQPQQDYSQWQGQGQGQTSGYNSTSWKGYGQQQSQQQTQQGYSTQPGYATQQGYSSYGNGSNTYNWNQQYYQNYGGWGQQQVGTTAATGAVAGSTAATGTSVAATGASAYDPYNQWNQFSQYGYSTSTGAAATGATGTTSHSGK